MPRSVNHLSVSCDRARAFDFVSDLRHASLWDPNTKHVDKLTPGGIGVGTRFLLTARLPGLSLKLPYGVVSFERPKRFTLSGQTWYLQYREQVEFRETESGTSIAYVGWARLRGVLSLGNPILSCLYQRIADVATERIPQAIVSQNEMRSSPHGATGARSC